MATQFGIAGTMEMIFTRLHGGNRYPTDAQIQTAYNAVIATGVDSMAIGLVAFSELVFAQLVSAGAIRWLT